MLEQKIPEPRLTAQPSTGSEDGSSSAKQVLQFPVQNRFRTLWDLGYRHLVPVVPHDAVLSPRSHLAKRKGDVRGKAPGQRGSDGEWYGLKGWQTSVPTEADLATWFATGAGVGLRLGLQHDGTYLNAVDADTTHKPSALVILAEMDKAFPDAPVRVGRKPKALYLVRTRDALPYCNLNFGEGAVEILTKGKQAVFHGIHPGTQEPYRIVRPEQSPGRPILPTLADLPLYDAADLRALLKTLAEILPGAKAVYAEGGGDRGDVVQERLKGKPELVRRAMEALPNRYPVDGYQAWVKLAAALRGACQDDYALGLELFEDYSAKAEIAGEGGESPARVYRSLSPPFSVGASQIYEWAEERSGGKFDRTALWFDEAAAAAAAERASDLPLAGEAAPAVSDVFEMLSLGEIINRPPPRFVIGRHVPEHSVGFLYGDPGTGKSFMALDWALHIAFGRPTWHGDDIEADPAACVVYLAGEGAQGFRTRALAWAQHHGIPTSEIDNGRFRLVPVSVNLMVPKEVEKLARTIRLSVGRACLVVVDTVSRSMPGADENLQKEMTLFVAACDAIKRAFGCVVLGVHHANQRGGMRGSGVLLGAGDFVFKFTRAKGSTVGTLFCEKQKDGPDGWSDPYRFDAVYVDGGSSLVPTRHVVTVVPEAETTSDETARVLTAMDAAWKAGQPWAKTKRGGGRYAGTHIARQFGIPVDRAEALLSAWTAAGLIAIQVYDTHGKRSGYCVLTYTAPPAAPVLGVFQ